MASWKHSCLAFVLLPSLGMASTGAAHRYVSKISVVGGAPFQLQIETNASKPPESQIVSDPERLVIDIHDALPRETLHGIAVRRQEVKGVRVGLFSRTPAVTRIVVDLKQPQWYRITPNPDGFLVSLGDDVQRASVPQPTVGWVSTKLSLTPAHNTRSAFAVKNTALKSGAVNLPTVLVRFANGLMSIHANNATLSEVLFEIQKQTGAEIAIPSGTELDRVAADFGPASPSEVMQQLLNGSGLNFVVVGSEKNPNALRRVILSRSAGPPDSPAAFAQVYTPVPPVENVQTETPDIVPIPEDESPPLTQPGNSPAAPHTPNQPQTPDPN